MAGIEVNEADYKKIIKALDSVKAPKQDYYSQVGRRLVSMFQMGFRLSRAPDGTAWAPIKHRVGQPLKDRGTLMRSITSRLLGDSDVEVGTDLEYARVLQEGFKGTVKVKAHQKKITQAFGKKLKFPVIVNVKAHAKNVSMKGREFLGIRGPQKQMIVKVTTAYLMKIAKGGI